MPRASHQERLAQVIKIREAALLLLARHGQWEKYQGFPHLVRVCAAGGFAILHRTPFRPLPTSNVLVGEGVSRELQRKLAGDYELDISKDLKVFNIIWNDERDESIEVVNFTRGIWECAFLTLAANDPSPATPPR